MAPKGPIIKTITDYHLLINRFKEISGDPNEDGQELHRLAKKARWSLFAICCKIFVTFLTPIYFHRKSEIYSASATSFNDHQSLISRKNQSSLTLPPKASSEKKRSIYDQKIDDLVSDSDYEKESFTMHFHLPFNLGHSRNRPLAANLLHLWMLFVMIKFSCLIVVHLKFEHAYLFWSPNSEPIKKFPTGNLSSSSNRSLDCYPMKNFGPEDLEHYRKLQYLLELKRKLGTFVLGPDDLYTFCCTMLMFVVFIFYTFALNHQDFQLNPLTFHFKPSLERNRIQARCMDLAISIFGKQSQLASQPIESRRLTFSYGMNFLNGQFADFYSEYINHSLQTLNRRPLSKGEFVHLLSWWNDRKSLKKTNQLAMNITSQANNNSNMGTYSRMNIRLVPAHLSVSNYKKQMRIEVRLTIVWCIFSTLIVYIVLGGLWLIELWKRVHLRLDLYECRDWQQPTALINNNNYSTTTTTWLQDYYSPILDGMDLDERQFRLYANYHEQQVKTWWTIYHDLILGVELVKTFDYRVGFFVLELFLISNIILTWLGFYWILLCLNFLSIQIWLKQIKDQLIIAKEMMQSYDSMMLFTIYTKKHIEDPLMHAYLNFILFKRDYYHVARLYRFLMLQLAIMTCGAAIFCLCIETKTANVEDRLYSLMITSSVIVILDVCCLMSVRFTSQVSSMFKMVNLIMAKASTISMESSYVVGLWRQQILTPVETEKAFGFSIMGFDLSYSNFIQLNSYVLGGVLYIFQSRSLKV